ncbi:MAG: hypothetical protein V1802_00490 [Candidatus Aenigmatarchaeota archaeon]
MKKTKEAFIWVVEILKAHKIPYRISGGFAARIYGTKRPLADIDIEVPDKYVDKILPHVQNFVVRGPARFKDKNWDIYLLTIKYKGQMIDFSGTDTEKLFSRKRNRWVKFSADFPKVTRKKVYGKTVNVIRKEDLIYYKNIIRRRVDIKDIKELSGGLFLRKVKKK